MQLIFISVYFSLAALSFILYQIKQMSSQNT